jgi:hypothetical protein
MKTGRTIQELAQEVMRQAQTKSDWQTNTENMRPVLVDDHLELAISDKFQLPIRDLAHDQIAEHVGIPKRYYDRMRAEAPKLLASNIDTWFKKYPKVRMVRVLDDHVRAFLSNGYLRLDNYDFVNAILPVLTSRNLEIMSCEVTEKRLYLKAVDKKLFRDVPVGYKMGDGSHQIFDTVAPAIICSNSEVGYGRFVVETGVYTKACTNMALFANSGMKRTHLGQRHQLLEEVDNLDAIMSDEAKAKQNEALWLQVRDLIKSAFNKDVVERRVEQLNAASGQKITGRVEKVMDVTAMKLGLTEDEKDNVLKFLVEGGQLSQYGLHSALTRAAHEVESYDRATELEYAGGRVVELTPPDWKVFQAA